MVTTEEKQDTATNTSASAKLGKGEYIEGVGRRKNAVARVRIASKNGTKRAFVVNDKNIADYFPTEEMQHIVREALQKVKAGNTFDVSARVVGGGVHAQAEALRHGLARALVAFNEEWRPSLKKSGFLSRDPRMVERKKFGKKKARKSPQWSKR